MLEKNGAGFIPEIEDVWEVEEIDIANLTDEQEDILQNHHASFAMTDDSDEYETWLAYQDEESIIRILNKR